MEELEDLPFGHHGGGLGQHLEDLQFIGGHRQGQGFGQEKVPHQDHRLVAPDGVGGGRPPAHAGRVDDVVVQQGGGVKIFKDGGKTAQMIALAAAHPGAQDEQQRPDALAAVSRIWRPTSAINGTWVWRLAASASLMATTSGSRFFRILLPRATIVNKLT